MIESIKNKIQIYSNFENKQLKDLSILVSFSGGIDSTVLSLIMLDMRKKYRFTLYLMHFNHHFTDKANEMQEFCRTFSQMYNII